MTSTQGTKLTALPRTLNKIQSRTGTPSVRGRQTRQNLNKNEHTSVRMAAPTSFVTDLLVAASRRETERHEAAVEAAKAAWRRVVDDPALGDASQEAADAWAAVEAAEEPFREAAWEEKEVLEKRWLATDTAVLVFGLTLREYEELRTVWEKRVERLARIVTLYELLDYKESAAVRRADLGVAHGELREIVEYIEARHAEVAATRELIALRAADEAAGAKSAATAPNWKARVEVAKREAEARDTWWSNRLHDCDGLELHDRLVFISTERQADCAPKSELGAVVRVALEPFPAIRACRDPRVLALLWRAGI